MPRNVHMDLFIFFSLIMGTKNYEREREADKCQKIPVEEVVDLKDRKEIVKNHPVLSFSSEWDSPRANFPGLSFLFSRLAAREKENGAAGVNEGNAGENNGENECAVE